MAWISNQSFSATTHIVTDEAVGARMKSQRHYEATVFASVAQSNFIGVAFGLRLLSVRPIPAR